jgi:hypothetical protein
VWSIWLYFLLVILPVDFRCQSLFVKLWYHDGKRIVPVTVQVWDCLCSLLGTALFGNVSMMDS